MESDSLESTVTLLLKQLNEEEPSDDEDIAWLEFKLPKKYDNYDRNEEQLSTTKSNTAPLGQVKNEPKIQFTTPVKTEPKTPTLTQLKTDSKPEISTEIKTDLDSTLKQERFISSNIYNSMRSDQTKRCIDDHNYSISEYIHQQKKGKLSNSPTGDNHSPLVFDHSASYSSSYHSSSHQSSSFNGLSSSTAVNNYGLPDYISRASMNRNNSNYHNIKEEERESFMGYNPPSYGIPITPRPGDIVLVNELQYEIMMTIGEGGSGKVFLAFSLKYRDFFALKWVLLRDDQDKQNVKNEIELMFALRKSQNIIKLCDSEITPRVAYMVLEYGSKSFADIIKFQSTQEWDITFFKYYWRQMLNAVSATHNHCIVHADLKPANFVGVHGRLKLIDFGIADRIPDYTTRIGREYQAGTANFMAPEALMELGTRFGKQFKQGRPSDVWSLGCILYQMIFSKPPFYHIEAAGRINAITDPKHDIPFPLTVKYGNEIIQIPDELRRILKLCLNRDPDMRPTVEELLKDPFINS